MSKGGPSMGGAFLGGLGSLLLIAALWVTALQFRPGGPDILGILIATVCWFLGFACYIIRWRG